MKKIGKKPVYDISVADAEHYILENGVVTHNTGMYYIAEDIWIVGRNQAKDGTDVSGYKFIIKIDKSRTVKEGSKFPVEVSFNEGIRRWSGLFDLAVEFGYITSPKKGWFHYEGAKSNVRKSDIENSGEFWQKILKETDLAKKIEQKYKLPDDMIIDDDVFEI